MKAKTNNRILIWRQHRIPVTASFGLAPYGPGTQRDSLLLLADRDLYAGLLRGRNFGSQALDDRRFDTVIQVPHQRLATELQ